MKLTVTNTILTYLSLESELSCKLHGEGFPEGEDMTQSAVLSSLLNGKGNNVKSWLPFVLQSYCVVGGSQIAFEPLPPTTQGCS